MLSKGDAWICSGRDRTLDNELRQAPRLLVERAGRDGEDHDRANDRREYFLKRTARGLLLLLARLLGSEQPPPHLPDPRGSACTQVRKISIGLRSVGTVGPRNFPGVPVQPDERVDRQPPQRICCFDRDRY